MHNTKINILDIKSKKNSKTITALTAYDYPSAKAVDEAGIDMVLVGDSLGMVVLGYQDTVSVTMEEMIHHTKAVVRGVKNALVVTDMPFGSYNCSIYDAINNANRLIKEGKADAVKVEGGKGVFETVKSMVDAGIPVQGHIGLTPQTATSIGGFKVQGKCAKDAKKIIDDAKLLDNAGCFSIVLEAIPASLAEYITNEISVPTIGIGAGPACDGQLLVIHDLLGLYDQFCPKFVKKYVNLNVEIKKALSCYKMEVENGIFPSEGHSFKMPQEEIDKILQFE